MFVLKNPANGRQSISQPMRIVAPIPKNPDSKAKIADKKIKLKKNARRFYTLCKLKKWYLRPLLFKDSKSLKMLDIRLWKVGAKRRLNGTSKVNTQTDRQTHRHTDRHIYGRIDLKKASAQRADALKIR